MKRGASGLSCIVAIHKQAGMTSHDVVNRCRRIFGEKRVGHTGTLDPAASGILVVCIGPATRLNPYLTAHDKRYRFVARFGSATDTDDAEGVTIENKAIPKELFDHDCAHVKVAQLIGVHQQLPPAYSAIKVDGRRAYAAARSGHEVVLEPREIEIYDANLLSLNHDGENVSWELVLKVSKGTYVRSIARDMGCCLGTVAHVEELERIASGSIELADCVSLNQLEKEPYAHLIDPVKLLGFAHLEVMPEYAKKIRNGRELTLENLSQAGMQIHPSMPARGGTTTGILGNGWGLKDDELVSIVSDGGLRALYRYDLRAQSLQPQCVFSIGVSRGVDY